MPNIKILYVEDEPFLSKIVKESLESRDFEVRLAEDGEAALTAFREFEPDICVLDVMLPKRDGFALGELIRREDSRTPIIFLTAKNQTEDVVKGFRSGGNDYVRKPFSMEELIVRINNLLLLAKGQNPSQVPDGDIQLGKYIFSPQKYELRLGEQTQRLSHRETELIRILAEHQNQAVQRKDILKEIWGDDSFFNSRNLDVYITKLRGYLKDDPDLQIITLKGVGYHFVAPSA
jgi:DNA-binding response OmpR family regulator